MSITHARSPAWRRYLRFWGSDPGRDLDDELRFHLEMREREYRTGGLDAGAARQAALRRFGDVRHVRQQCHEIDREWERSMHHAELFSTLVSDVRFGVRQLARNRGFTAAAVLALALGIGANSTIFGLVDAVVLRPLPGIREPERLVELAPASLSYPSYLDFRDAVSAFHGLAGFRDRPMALIEGRRSQLVTASLVSGNYFSVLGVRAARGRTITELDDRPGAAAVAVISHAFWRAFFAQDSAVLGRTVHLNGAPVTIVGVSDPGFRGTRLRNGPEVWVPIAAWPQVRPSSLRRLDVTQRNWGWLTAVGRLRDGATLAQADAQLAASVRRQREAYPDQVSDGSEVTATPAGVAAVGSRSYGEVVRFVSVLTGVVGFVLLIACANVANLLLARSAHRRREIAVRLAMGAKRARLVRQLLTESLVLTVLATGVGLAAMAGATRLLAGYRLPGGVPLSALDLGADARVVAFTVTLAALTSVLFGLVPALRSSRQELVDALREGSPGAGRARTRLRGALVTAQVSLSLLLLIGAGLFTRSLQRALHSDVGFRGDNVALATVNAGLPGYDTLRAHQLYHDVSARISALPGVLSSSWTAAVPLTDEEGVEGFAIPGRAPRADDERAVEVNVVSAGFLRTLGIQLVRGREFDERDTRVSPPVVMVNETLASRYWGDGDPIGQRVVTFDDTLTVVGVVRDLKYHRLDEEPRPYVYGLLWQNLRLALFPMTLLVRTSGDPEHVLAPVQRELRATAPDVPVSDVGTFDDRYGELLMPQRLGVALLGLFSTLAMVISAVGIYGVVAYAVSQRTREIGIRMALGARGGSVLRLVMGESLSFVMLGIVLGLALAAALTRAASSFLYDVSPTDAATFAGTSLLLLALAALAAYLPARRATRVDPVRALRVE